MRHKRDGLLLAFTAALSVTATSMAQQNPVVGAWQGSVTFMGNPGLVQTVLLPNGVYRTLIQTSFQGRPIVVSEQGRYEFIDNSTLHFIPTDYEPKTNVDGTPLVRPPESIYKFWFVNGSTLVMQSPGGEPVQLTRVQ